MTPKFSSLLRSGLVALGVAAGVSAPAFAVPIAAGLSPTAMPAAQEGGTGIILVQREFRGDGRYTRRGDRGDRWRYRRQWRGDGDRWRDRRHRRGDRYRGGNRYRRNYRRGWYDNDWYGGSGIYLNFGLPAYNSYDPYYAPRYYAPRYAPRRVYRGGGSAHVQWCYDRYRSYRAYDNTFQPYSGPRQQCWSPYS
jgi:BA14K-like protein